LQRFLAGLVRWSVRDSAVLLIARDEPAFAQELGLAMDAEQWRGLGIFRVPEFTLEALQAILVRLAHYAGVSLADGAAASLVADSDGLPETLAINVNLAQRRKTALTRANWKPRLGDSWRESLESARARYASTDAVFRALRILNFAGVPARVSTTRQLARILGAPDPEAAVDGLVTDGLLGLRSGCLAAFSEEQMAEAAQSRADANAELTHYWREVANAIVEGVPA
jgi:hypothetical protein